MYSLTANLLGAGAVSFVVCIIIGLLALVVGCVAGFFVLKLVNDKKNKKIKQDAQSIIEKAKKEAKNIEKEAQLTAQEKALNIKTEAEKELNSRRIELEKLNDRFLQREEFINKKEQTLETKNENLENQRKQLNQKEQELKEKESEIDKKKDDILVELQHVAQMTKDEAKQILIQNMQEEARNDALKLVRDIEDEAVNNATKKATEIVTLAIQKYSADITSENTATTVALPNDEMKGRLIGREGRNIKAIEQATGIDLIIDDTPEAIVLSGFDPIRREIAKISIEKLIQDGRIHPARIEETVAKVTRDLNDQIKEVGEQAVLDAGVHGLHPELIKLVGRLKYRTSYGQNMLKHSLEVSYMARAMAEELGLDSEVAKRGGLLHDIGKAVDFEMEGTHVSLGVELAKKYKENEKVINCIEAHHGDVEFSCLEAVLVQAADVISSSRVGARRETMENYIKRVEKLEEISNSFKGVEKAYAIQAGREIRILVKPEEISDADALFLAKDIAKKIESEMEYPGQIKVHVIRETRSIEYAK